MRSVTSSVTAYTPGRNHTLVALPPVEATTMPSGSRLTVQVYRRIGRSGAPWLPSASSSTLAVRLPGAVVTTLAGSEMFATGPPPGGAPASPGGTPVLPMPVGAAAPPAGAAAAGGAWAPTGFTWPLAQSRHSLPAHAAGLVSGGSAAMSKGRTPTPVALSNRHCPPPAPPCGPPGAACRAAAPGCGGSGPGSRWGGAGCTSVTTGTEAACSCGCCGCSAAAASAAGSAAAAMP